MFFIALFSCNKIEPFSTKESFCGSKIVFKGDYVDVTTTPLTKSGGKTYYAFEIDSLQVRNWHWDYDYVDSSYVHYAGGIFEGDIKNLSIVLEKNRKYRIRCSIIEEREDKVYNENGYVFHPFVESRGQKVKVNNTFIYGGEKEVYLDSSCDAIYTENNDYNLAARVNRYYGEIFTDLITEDSDIILDMQRYNYGLHFIINPPKEGVLKVSQTWGQPYIEYELNSESSSINEQFIYAMPTRSYPKVNTRKTHEFEILWTKADGEIVDLSLGKREFYNKTMTTIKVDINDRIGSSDIELNYDSEMQHNDDIVVN